jgi:biotin transporter BioY
MKHEKSSKEIVANCLAIVFGVGAWAGIGAIWLYVLSVIATGNAGMDFALRLMVSLQAFAMLFRPAIIFTTFIASIGAWIGRSMFKEAK